jgi:hypothetical protein
MDIEGEEQRLLPHLLPALPKQCFLFIETHEGEAAREELLLTLQRSGFEIHVTRIREPYADLYAIRTAH